MKKERPILFSAPMVRAILEGRKTQTRRIVTVPWKGSRRALPYEPYYVESDGKLLVCDEYGDYRPIEQCSGAYAEVGDHLWVRETWAPHADEEETFRNYHAAQSGKGGLSEPGVIRPEIFYRADGGDPFINNWRPSIFCPRWASRITLEVTAVRVERLQAITEEDARAEGVDLTAVVEMAGGPGLATAWLAATAAGPRALFATGWSALHDKPGTDWDANPWVWVVEFKRLDADRRAA